MGTLANHLAQQFAAIGLSGWRAEPEAQLFSRPLAKTYGFDPRVDLLFHRTDGSNRRLVVELEISRADPVANQVKFLLAHAAGETGPEDALVSMFSPAIERGRRNVCGVFAGHLRSNGISAFALSLLPTLDPERVRALNRPDSKHETAGLQVENELARVSAVTEVQTETTHRIHFVGDVAEVVANVTTWNREIARAAPEAWTGRAIQYFVHDPTARQFAPSKFCAFLPAPRPGCASPPPTMTLALYTALGEEEARFDGHLARKHLEQSLAFESVVLEESGLKTEFGSWASGLGRRISLRRPVTIVRPPRWYR